MSGIKLQRRICLLNKQVRNLKIQLRFVNKRTNYLFNYIKEREKSFDIDDHIDTNSEESQKKKASNTRKKSPIIDDLDQFLMVDHTYNRTYSDEMKMFCYTIFSISSNVYRVLRDQLPLPSEQRLRKIFSQQIQKISKLLTDLMQYLCKI